MGSLRQDVTPDRIYVFTPDGHVVDLQPKSTPVDFAYRVHTEIGHKCRGAKVNGRIVPLNYQVKTGDQIEVLTSNNAKPRRDWLHSENGYVNTSRARAKVASWFKSQAREQNVLDGKSILETELKRVGLLNESPVQIAQDMHFKSVDDLYAALGSGGTRIGHVISYLQKQLEPEQKHIDQLSLLPTPQAKAMDGSDVFINGVGKLLSTLASCCQPLPGDPIVGYITQGRGVSIHKSDCSNLLNLMQSHTNRITQVSWGESPANLYPLELFIRAYDRRGLLKDITITLANEDVNVLAMNTVSQDDGTADVTIRLEVTGLQHLGQIINKIQMLPNIFDVYRHQQ